MLLDEKGVADQYVNRPRGSISRGYTLTNWKVCKIGGALLVRRVTIASTGGRKTGAGGLGQHFERALYQRVPENRSLEHKDEYFQLRSEICETLRSYNSLSTTVERGKDALQKEGN